MPNEVAIMTSFFFSFTVNFHFDIFISHKSINVTSLNFLEKTIREEETNFHFNSRLIELESS